MLAFTFRRIVMMVPILLGASILSFALVETSGDPVQEQIFLIEQSTGDPVSPDVVEELEAQLYYDRSMPERYWLWLTGIGETNGDIGLIQGKWGPSVEGPTTDIGGEVGERFWITVRLVLLAVVASVGIAILTGVISAVKQYSAVDYLLTLVGFVCLALPTFWFATLVKEAGVALNGAFGTDLFKTYRDSTRGFQGNGWEVLLDALPYMILPTFVLMLTSYASMARYQRAAMLEVLNSDYVRLARAKGVRNRTVMRRHALRTALIPIATFAPLAIVTAMGGSLVVERIFGWNGLGAYAYDSIKAADSFAVMAYLLIAGVLTLIGVLISDLLYGVLDPRIRYE
ncbi:ABC transporter permease [Glycomyces xiaoerkulensis]|uniref:ABC transporter permease n=1 Tax=Glycomyces xiaoerkulensis TaxID=2038139 RepID=UPI000C257862|nr:ABC transporter permease [Glycomyces xiaoerkulensis]